MDRLPEPTAAREEECPVHGPFMARNIYGRVWSKCSTCSEVRAAEDQRLRDQQAARDAERHHREALDTAAIPARFVDRTFDGFRAETPAMRRALTVCRDYAENFSDNARRGAGLVLAGRPGTGKSHLSVAILQSVLTRDVRYITCGDLIRAVRDTWRRSSDRTETQVLSYLQRLDLLVIDEVGVQYGTNGEQTILFDVLDRRYREIKPTILLTNQDKEEFTGFIGERTFDRVAETCLWVPFTWQSYRPQARKEAARASL